MSDGVTKRSGRRLVGAMASLVVAFFSAFQQPVAAETAVAPPEPGALRVASFNVNLARRESGVLIDALRAYPEGPAAARISAVLEIIRRVRPDVLLINELDYDPAGEALDLFARLLATPSASSEGLDLPHRFDVPVNTGEPTGVDLDRDGRDYGPGDAFGWGVHRGQFGMAILSRLPLDARPPRTFRTLRWSQAPWAAEPRLAGGEAFYEAAVWPILRLSSKNHWDVAVRAPWGAPLHLLASHPTPPVFDGDEDRNGLRNAAEIRFWRDYVSGDAAAAWIVDDAGVAGGLREGASFIVLGDLNADPRDGDGVRTEIRALLEHDRIQDPRPSSLGGPIAANAQGGVNAGQTGDPALDTADWRDSGRNAAGNLRVDYVLPSADLQITGAGVFWPAPNTPGAELVAAQENGRDPIGSDHRLVWVDIRGG